MGAVTEGPSVMSVYDASETTPDVADACPARFVSLEDAVNAVGSAGVAALVEQLVSIVKTANKPGYRVLDVDRTTMAIQDGLIARDPGTQDRWCLRRAEKDVRDQKRAGNKTDRYFGELTALVARRYALALKIVHVADVSFEALQRLYASHLYVVLEADRPLFDQAVATHLEEKNVFIKFHVMRFHGEAFDAFARRVEDLLDERERAEARANVFLAFFKNEMGAFAREKKMLDEFKRKSVGAKVVAVASRAHPQFEPPRIGAGPGDGPDEREAAWARARATTLAVIDAIRDDPEDRLEPLRALIEPGGVRQEIGVNREGRAPLFFASLKGKPNAVRYLLEFSDVNRQNGVKGSTALHAAAERGHVEVVDVLLDNPAVDVDAQRLGGSTALHLAARHGHAAVVDRLLARGANRALKTGILDGMTALEIAVHRFEESVDAETRAVYYGIVRALDDGNGDDDVEIEGELDPDEAERRKLEEAKTNGDYFVIE